MNVKNLFINLTDPVIFQTFGGEQSWTRIFAPAGTAVFKEGETSQDFYFVFSGNLVVDKFIDKDGSKKRIAALEAGDFFGEGALLSDKHRAATVTATTDCVLLKLSRDSFEKLIFSDPHAAVGITLGIVKVLNARFQNTNEELMLLHRVAQLVRESQGSSDLALKKIMEELHQSAHFAKAAIVTPEAVFKAVTEGMNSEQLAQITQGLDSVNLGHLQDAKQLSFIKDELLFTQIRKLDGGLLAWLVIQVSPECLEDETRLSQMLAEQVGFLLG